MDLTRLAPVHLARLAPIDLTRLAPARPLGPWSGRWTIAASVALHLAAFAALLSMTARRPPIDSGGAGPSYELVFDDGRGSDTQPPTPALPPAEPADVPRPDDAIVGAPAPPPTSEPSPDGVPSEAPETAQASAPPSPAPNAPTPAVEMPTAIANAQPSPPAMTAPGPPSLAFAPEAPQAEVTAPAQIDVLPAPTPPPAVRLEVPTAPEPPRRETMIVPTPPPPLPAPPAPPRPRPTPRAAPGTLSNPMDLSLGPSSPRPAPAARGSVASRSIDLSPGAPRQGPNPLDPYAQIRAANASADWNRGLEAYWRRHRYYPRQAVENGEDGTVVIELTVNRSGKVESVDLKSRSGSSWLDMAAIGTFRNGQLPPFTPEMTEDRITFTIPINYILLR